MIAPLLLLAGVLLAPAPPDRSCFIVGNNGIVGCHAPARAIAAATAPSPTPPPAPQRGSSPPGGRAGERSSSPNAPPSPSATPREAQLEHRVAALEQELSATRADREEAEAARAVAEQQRLSTLDELAGIRQELATARAATAAATEDRQRAEARIDDAFAVLQQADAELATGSPGASTAALSQAAEAFRANHQRVAAAAVAAAQDAAERRDLSGARASLAVAALSSGARP